MGPHPPAGADPQRVILVCASRTHQQHRAVCVRPALGETAGASRGRSACHPSAACRCCVDRDLHLPERVQGAHLHRTTRRVSRGSSARAPTGHRPGGPAPRAASPSMSRPRPLTPARPIGAHPGNPGAYASRPSAKRGPIRHVYSNQGAREAAAGRLKPVR